MWFVKSRIDRTPGEIVDRKKAVDKATRDNVNANKKLVTTIGNNGFTLIIAAAMGAQPGHKLGNSNGH